VKLTSATADEAGAVASLRLSAGFMVQCVLPFRDQFNMSRGHSRSKQSSPLDASNTPIPADRIGVSTP